MNDLTVKCCDCGKNFLVTKQQVDRLNEMGYGIYKRCRDCKENKINDRGEEIKFQCISCGCSFSMPKRKIDKLKQDFGQGFKEPRHCYRCKLERDKNR